MALSKGSSGSDVRELQEKLISLGYDVGSTGADGKFGSKTEAAVIKYQQDQNINDDGIVGSVTQSHLDSTGPDYASDTTTMLGPGGGDGTGNGSSYYDFDSYYDMKNPFATSSETDDWKYLLDSTSDNPVGDYSESEAVKAKREQLQKIIDSQPEGYAESEEVKAAKAKLKEIEDGKPADYVSKYDSTISELLDTIKNRGAFDVNTDTNYQTLYDNYKNSYQANASRAMRDAMGSAQGATGGYGSTYSQMVGQQAYDTTMQGLNDNNINLMNLAYSMYSDDRANDYNKLSAYQNQDNIDYSRYRDTVGDWKDDRSYYANRADNASATDYNRYRDKVSDWQVDRSYYDNSLNNERTFDYGQYQDKVAQWNTDRSFYGDMYNNSYANDLSQYQYDTNYNYNYNNNLYDRAMEFASQGISVPESYYDSLTDDEVSAINGVAQQTVADKQAAAAKGSGSGSSGSNGKWYSKVLAEAQNMKSKSGNINYDDVADYLVSMRDSGYITEEEADDIWSVYFNGGAKGINENEPEDGEMEEDGGGSIPTTYSEYIKVTGDNTIMTANEFKKRKAAGSSSVSGYDDYEHYLAAKYAKNR